MSVTSGDVEPWELHSELVFVSPEVCKRALELLPERDPYGFLARPRQPVGASISADEPELAPGLPAAVARYTLWRIGETARFGLLIVGAIVALALLVELLR